MIKLVGSILFLSTVFNICFAQELVEVKNTVKKNEIYGYSRAYKFVTISSEVGGKCIKVSGEIGEKIELETPAFIFDDTTLKLQIDQNKIAKGIVSRKIEHLEGEVTRNAKLLKSESITEVEYNDLLFQRDLAKLEEKLKENQMAQLEDQLSKYMIFAPKGYTLVERYIESNSLAQPGTPLALYGDYQRLIVPISVNQEEYDSIKAIKNLELSLVEFGGKKVKAKVLRRHSRFLEASRKFQVDLELLDDSIERVGGIKTLLTIDVPVQESFTIPENALYELYEEFYVYPETGEKIKIKVMQIHNGFAEIKSKDLSLGMKIKQRK